MLSIFVITRVLSIIHTPVCYNMVGGAMTSVARVHIFPLSYPAHYPPLDFLLHSTLHLTSYPLTISFFCWNNWIWILHRKHEKGGVGNCQRALSLEAFASSPDCVHFVVNQPNCFKLVQNLLSDFFGDRFFPVFFIGRKLSEMKIF